VVTKALGFFFKEIKMTQLELAKQGIISPQIKQVAQQEDVSQDVVQQYITEGKIVIPFNVNHANLAPCGIGNGLTVKVNANIGTSSDYGNLDSELEKLRIYGFEHRR
jgi:phosphomethylpyrimidine synthase